MIEFVLISVFLIPSSQLLPSYLILSFRIYINITYINEHCQVCSRLRPSPKWRHLDWRDHPLTPTPTYPRLPGSCPWPILRKCLRQKLRPSHRRVRQPTTRKGNKSFECRSVRKRQDDRYATSYKCEFGEPDGRKKQFINTAESLLSKAEEK